MVDQLTNRQIDDLRDTFLLYDTDGDGRLSREEFGTVLKELGHKISASELQDLINDSVFDGDGTIQLNEFISLMTQRIEGLSEEELKSVFALFDQDNDGYINNDDIIQVMNKFGERMSETQMAVVVEEFDFLCYKKVNFEEFAKRFLSKK